MTVDVTEGRWRKDLANVQEALAPWVVTFDDGWQGVEPEAPERLRSLLSGLLSVGCARGWS